MRDESLHLFTFIVLSALIIGIFATLMHRINTDIHDTESKIKEEAEEDERLVKAFEDDRSSYTVYLDGEIVDPMSVDIRQYQHTVNTDDKVVYLAPKPTIQTGSGGGMPMILPVPVPVRIH